ncbi:leucine-rich repeat flightless-interacting protein 2 [Nematolebias whitei]|uniref:leucine-rich repeat flightless-interacting protein 2 n=1 Tax=Nematolebias whitei TaxID=451745 RepID=UPI00189845AD|nr:leucine-rich repeat flightless-interacting protein 2 [Nematolebias whitei]
MGTQGTGRKRSTKKERTTAEEDALNLIAREAEARLAAKRAARAEAREIRMKELERQQKEIFQVQKKYYGLNTKLDERSDGKWGDIEQWMEDSEKYSRPSRIQTLSDEDERMSVGSRGSVRVEDKDYLEKGSRAASALTATTLTSLGGTSSRRGSRDTALTVDAESAIREIKEIHELKDQIQDVETKYMQNLKEAKDALAEVEEKYRKAMVSNAQLDNEKNNLMYQVDTLKDSLMELEELLSESRREYEDKVREFEREKHAHGVLQFQFNEVKETLKQSEELLNEIRQLRLKQDAFVREISDLQETVEWKDKKIGALERQKEYTDAVRVERDELREEVVKLKDVLKKHGIILGPDLSVNGDAGEAEVDETPGVEPESRSAPDPQTSQPEGNGMLEIRLRKLVDEREKMIEQVKKLKAQLEQKAQKNGSDCGSSPDGEIIENGNDPNIMDFQRDSNRHVNDLKFKLAKAEQEATALEQNVTRLEGQVTRYKSAAENAEKVEDELKAEKRKLQRELRSALDKVEELESSNSHLCKRMEKMKTSRGAAQTP